MPLQEDAHDNWDLANPPEEGARAAKHRLVKEVKRLIDAVALLDVADDDAAAVEAITTRVRDAADVVAARPSHAATGLAMAHGPTHALAERSPFAGRANPLAAPMTITVDGDITRATATYSAAYEGPPNTLHGGFVAAAFGVAFPQQGSDAFEAACRRQLFDRMATHDQPAGLAIDLAHRRVGHDDAVETAVHPSQQHVDPFPLSLQGRFTDIYCQS
jgi:hypothetical protein